VPTIIRGPAAFTACQPTFPIGKIGNEHHSRIVFGSRMVFRRLCRDRTAARLASKQAAQITSRGPLSGRQKVAGTASEIICVSPVTLRSTCSYRDCRVPGTLASDKYDGLFTRKTGEKIFSLKVSVKTGDTIGMQGIFAEAPQFDERVLRIAPRVDEFEGYSDAHGRRIAEIADKLGSGFNLASRDRFFLQQAALVHDIGEMIMNRDYIRSPRVLSVEERLDLQRHPVIGEQETAKMGLPRGVQLLVRWHHEWWNGAGYPDGLTGEQIPLAARILRVADCYAAVTSPRPFRPAMSEEQARRHLIEWAGLEFDPMIVKTFLARSEPAPFELELNN
jgi:HD-GYP domain-containing protein (c-di-GMP phosphodiesterase class II)